jgi:outer membrane lipoprotein carrier protein
MGKKINHTSILILFFVFWTVTVSQTWASSNAVPMREFEAIQEAYSDLTSLSFDFKQIIRSNGRDREGAGSSIFYRPTADTSGIMRWNYTKPDMQVILNDGKELSIYTRKNNQLVIMSAEKLQSDITYSFFAGQRKLTDDFKLYPADRRYAADSVRQKLLVVKLIPKKPHGQIKSLHLWFDNKSMIRKLVMEDHFETITELIFSNIKTNSLSRDSAKTTAALVQLNLPPNTEIIRQ